MRPVALSMLVLALYGCASAPSKAPSEASVLNYRKTVFADNLRMGRQLFRVAEQIRIAAAPLCDKTELTTGMRWADPSQFEFPDVAGQQLGLRDGQQVIFVVARNSPADRAGLRAGDAIVDFDRATNRIVAQRGDERIAAIVIPVSECAVSVSLADSSKTANDLGDPNAWGGNDAILVNTAMMRITLNENELALIVGHELSHIIHRDETPQVATTVAIKTAGLISAVAGFGALGEVTARAATSPAARKRELDADSLGLRLTAAAGFDPELAIPVFQRIPGEGGWLLDHPSSPARISALRVVLQDIHRRKAEGQPIIP